MKNILVIIKMVKLSTHRSGGHCLQTCALRQHYTQCGPQGPTGSPDPLEGTLHHRRCSRADDQPGGALLPPRIKRFVITRRHGLTNGGLSVRVWPYPAVIGGSGGRFCRAWPMRGHSLQGQGTVALGTPIRHIN